MVHEKNVEVRTFFRPGVMVSFFCFFALFPFPLRLAPGSDPGASRSAPASPSLFSSPMHKGKVAAIGSPGSGSVTLTAANPLYDAAGEKPSRQPRSSLAPKPRDADGGLPKVVSDAGGG